MKSKLSLVLLLAVVCRLSAQIEVTSTGNVGIGTTNPGERLEVNGGNILVNNSTGILKFGPNTPNQDRIQLYSTNYGLGVDSTDLVIHSGTGGGTTFKNDTISGTVMMRITSVGNLGIGTTIPSIGGGYTPKLHIAGAYAAIALEGTAAAKKWGLGVDSNGAFEIFESTSNAYSPRLLITNSGNVGIGTTNPLSKLHVQGIGRFGLNEAGTNNMGGILVASGTGVGGARQYWIGASNPTSHNNNMFQISDYNGSTNFPLVTIYGMHAGSAGGNVGIGTETPGYKLTVVGSVRAVSFIGDVNSYADFVFKPGYKLASLNEVEAAIQRDGRLPGIPSESEAREHGIDLSAMQVKLLQKVEELTLHLIAHEKQLDRLQQENATLRRELAGLKDR